MEFCKFQTVYDLSESEESPKKFYDRIIINALLEKTEASQADARNFDKELQFYLGKKPTYKVYPSMAVALSTTNIDIPTEELHLPFKTFEIQLAPKTIFVDKSTVEGDIPVGDVYVGAILISEDNLIIQGTKPRSGRILNIVLDLKDTKTSTVLDGRIRVLLEPNETIFNGLDRLQNVTDKSG